MRCPDITSIVELLIALSIRLGPKFNPSVLISSF